MEGYRESGNGETGVEDLPVLRRACDSKSPKGKNFSPENVMQAHSLAAGNGWLVPNGKAASKDSLLIKLCVGRINSFGRMEWCCGVSICGARRSGACTLQHPSLFRCSAHGKTLNNSHASYDLSRTIGKFLSIDFRFVGASGGSVCWSVTSGRGRVWLGSASSLLRGAASPTSSLFIQPQHRKRHAT